MNLFIDTNVLLSFFHLSGEDIVELHKLVGMIELGKLTLWVPEQVCNEFRRNRDGKIGDAVKPVRSLKIGAALPAFYKNYDEYKELIKALTEANKKFSALIKVVEADISARTLKADELIAELFIKSKIMPADQHIHLKALERVRLGNPPGKKAVTIGDELNWEHLLNTVPSGEDLHVISQDSDYSSALDPIVMHSYLLNEWEQKKKAKVFLYTKIADFFAEHFPAIKLVSDIAKAEAFDKLAASVSFYQTHLAVAELMKFAANFTPQDADKLLEIAAANNQVRLIVGDPDVSQLYQKAMEVVGVKADTAKAITELLAPPPDDNIDEILALLDKPKS